jgi:hypothetical protein
MSGSGRRWRGPIVGIALLVAVAAAFHRVFTVPVQSPGQPPRALTIKRAM